MRALLLTSHYAAGPGGAETVVALTEQVLRGSGHEVVPFAVDEPGGLPTPYRTGFPPPAGAGARTEVGRRLAAIYSRQVRRALDTLLRRVRPDVAHVHHVWEFVTLSVLDTLRAQRIPVVLTVHDYKPVCPNYRLFAHGRVCERCLHGGRLLNVVRHHCLAGEGSRWRELAAAAEVGLAAVRGWWRAVDVFVAPSAFLRTRLIAGGLPAERIVVVPNPVPPGPAPASPEPGRFVYSGRLVGEKGVDVLLDAAGDLPIGAWLDVYGTGRAEATVRRRVEREALPVRLHGFTSGMHAELAGATATVLPSRWYENCPMSLLEAAAAGVPAVASAIGGIPELVEDGRTGLLVPPGDVRALASALRALAADPSYAARLGAAARERVLARHDPARYRDALLACYGAALRRSAA